MDSIRFGTFTVIALAVLLASASVVLCKQTNNLSSTTPSSKTKENDADFDERVKKSREDFDKHDKDSDNFMQIFYIVGGIFLAVAVLVGVGYGICLCVGVGMCNENRRRNHAGGFAGNQMVYGANQPSMAMVAQPPAYNYAQPIQSGWGRQ